MMHEGLATPCRLVTATGARDDGLHLTATVAAAPLTAQRRHLWKTMHNA